jgi:solute carrier family 6 serotonin transporter-like protein 4
MSFNLEYNLILFPLAQGGMYLVDLLNVYGPGIAILFLVFVEAMGVSWCYGTQRFSDDIESMLGFQPGPFWKITWAYVSPIFILVDYYNIQ